LCGHGPEILEIIAKAESLIRSEIGKYIYGTDDDSLEKSVVEKLIAKSQTIAVAESCTGGFLGHHITSIPGASKVFLGGFLTYSNKVKEEMLGVGSETLEKYGAVSKEVSIEMAEGARLKSKADHAISITGIAGPEGGTEDKPVGTVWLGLSSVGRQSIAIKKFNPYDRGTFKQATVNQALELIRRRLVKNE
jgi:nicotinamide-nucleotide amidase